jgi:hypothetical protein
MNSDKQQRPGLSAGALLLEEFAIAVGCNTAIAWHIRRARVGGDN